jgi:hypothetical protein
MPRLLRLTIRNAAASPPISGGRERRESSPPGTFSTLITSAPMSASISPQTGPAMTWASSITLSPESGPFFNPMSIYLFVQYVMRQKGQAFWPYFLFRVSRGVTNERFRPQFALSHPHA